MAKGQPLKPEQIVTLLRQIDVLTTNGKSLAQACKEVGTVEQSYYRWRKIYGGMKVDQAKKYKDLELENTRLKKLVADLSLREVMLKEVIREASKQWGGRFSDGSGVQSFAVIVHRSL
jgi:putative transposase